MGSLISAPKAPKPIVVQQPAPTPQPTTETLTPNPQTPEQVQRDESKERARSLLARERSRFGTIATGFRGLLQEKNQGARKTLLGE